LKSVFVLDPQAGSVEHHPVCARIALGPSMAVLANIHNVGGTYYLIIDSFVSATMTPITVDLSLVTTG